jgi:hypothetical protein
MMDEKEKQQILKEFPNIKLSYETIGHKKVYDFECIVVIPTGKKCFAWFSTYMNKDVCYIMEIGDQSQIINIKIINACYNKELCYGTIFYGTLFYNNNNRFFNIEDIFYYKGKNISKISWFNKLHTFQNIFIYDIKQVSYNNSFIVFGLPLMHTNFNEVINQINLLPYPILFIQYRLINSIINIKYTKNIFLERPHCSKINNEIVFKIKPDIQNDIYHLYTFDNANSDNYYGIAYIPNYKTSVMMNTLFRNIKENHNLDSLEESDSEDEFQNEKIDRFVSLDKCINMTCVYNNKFKKWEPIRVSPNGSKIITSKELSKIEKK